MKKKFYGHTDEVLTVDFDENFIVSGSRDKTIKASHKVA